MGWFILSQCCGAAGAIVDAGFCLMQGGWESWPWGSAGSMQLLMARLGVPGTPTRSTGVNAGAILPVQRLQHRERCGVQLHLCSAHGCSGSGVGMTLKWQLLVQSLLAMTTLYLEEASEVVSEDASVLLL